MSYVKHQPCPKCGSRDNLAVYADHEYCFGCGYVNFYAYHPRRILDTKETTRKIVSLPEDIAPYIPAVADNWIKKYDLTQRELNDNRVVWSEQRSLLVFPYFDEKMFLFGWQGRYFGSDPKHPKWTGSGNFKDMVRVYHPNPLTSSKDTSIIIIEDIISTIKLSRQYNSSCLFGSTVNFNHYITIFNKYKPKEFIIWLDKDKMKESYKYSYSFNKIGIACRVISTDLDPKLYSNDEIRRIIES